MKYSKDNSKLVKEIEGRLEQLGLDINADSEEINRPQKKRSFRVRGADYWDCPDEYEYIK